MSIVLGALGIYLAIGLLFGLWFVAFGVGRVDPVARQAGAPFRVLILPGAAALWPWLLMKWVGAPRAGNPGDAGKTSATEAHA